MRDFVVSGADRRTLESWLKMPTLSQESGLRARVILASAQGESVRAVAMTRLSCHRFRANQVRLWLSVIAYNLGNLWRRLALPAGIANWSLTSLQQRLVTTGAV
jgi:hypothetical protein